MFGLLAKSYDVLPESISLVKGFWKERFVIWGFPKIRGTILGIPIIRTIVYWGLYWGSLILGNYHINFRVRHAVAQFGFERMMRKQAEQWMGS